MRSIRIRNAAARMLAVVIIAVGTLGGGCVEAEVRRVAIELLAADQSKLLEFRLDHDYGWDDGLICGGIMDIHIQPIDAARSKPFEDLLDALRPTLTIDDQILGRHHITEGRTRQRRAGRDLPRLARRFWAGRRRLRIRRFVAPAARHIDRAEQYLQQMQRATGLKPVRVGRNAAHRMQRDRAASHRFVAPARPIGPRHGEFDFLVKCSARHLGREPPDCRRPYPASAGDALGRVAGVQIALGNKLEHRHGSPAIGKHCVADEPGLPATGSPISLG